jgi:hypothetical protein
MLALTSASANALFLAFCFNTRQRVAWAVGCLPSNLSFRCNASPPRLASIDLPQDDVGGWTASRFACPTRMANRQGGRSLAHRLQNRSSH